MTKTKTKTKTSSSPFAQLAEMKAKLAKEEQAAQTAQQGKLAAPPPPPPRSKQDTRARIKAATSTTEDTQSFARLMGGVAQLPATGKHRVPVQGPDPGRDYRDHKLETFRTKEEEETEQAHEQLRSLAMGGVRFETSDDGSHVEGRRIDVNPSLLRRLRRGQFPVDGRLDLHGLNLEQARLALVAFLARMRQQGETAVLVVHGKGQHSPRGMGILRGEIAAWLSQGAAAQHTAAFATAQNDDGGEGATYVLLVGRSA